MVKEKDNFFDALEALQIIECPICLEILNSPVFQCANGHLICSSCLDQIDICPSCRKRMPQQRIRNLAVENLVSLKCLNFKLGCQVWLTSGDKADHILNCKYKSRDYCHRIALKKLGVQCNKMIRKCELPLHMKNNHKVTLIENNEASISQELLVENLVCAAKCLPVLFSAFDEHFFLDCEIIPYQSSYGATISWKCISTGSVSMAQEFSVTMNIFPTDKDVSLKWEGKVISVDQLGEKDLNFFSLTMNTLRELTISRNLKKLSWKMNIVIQRKGSTTSAKNPVAPVINMNPRELALPTAEQIIQGKYQLISGDATNWAEIIYSRNGSLWTRKVKNNFEHQFTFGKEFTYRIGVYEVKSTIFKEDNKLIHVERQFKYGRFVQNVTRREDFSDNKMSVTIFYDGRKSLTRVYMKESQ